MERDNPALGLALGNDLKDAEVVHRYLQIEDRTAEDGELVEQDWFVMGDQESWIESHPNSTRSWETHRRS